MTNNPGMQDRIESFNRVIRAQNRLHFPRKIAATLAILVLAFVVLLFSTRTIMAFIDLKAPQYFQIEKQLIDSTELLKGNQNKEVEYLMALDKLDSFGKAEHERMRTPWEWVYELRKGYKRGAHPGIGKILLDKDAANLIYIRRQMVGHD